MIIDDKERLTRHRDWSDQAIAWRLHAAVKLSGLKQNKLAEALNLRPQTLNSQIIKGRPSTALMTYFYRNHRVDYNFFIYGEIVQLPGDVQEKLTAILAEQKLS